MRTEAEIRRAADLMVWSASKHEGSADPDERANYERAVLVLCVLGWFVNAPSWPSPEFADFLNDLEEIRKRGGRP